jgi:hypothetical protein
VTVSGLHELVGNALVMKGEIPRTLDLRQEDLPFPDDDPENGDNPKNGEDTGAEEDA